MISLPGWGYRKQTGDEGGAGWRERGVGEVLGRGEGRKDIEKKEKR